MMCRDYLGLWTGKLGCGAFRFDLEAYRCAREDNLEGQLLLGVRDWIGGGAGCVRSALVEDLEWNTGGPIGVKGPSVGGAISVVEGLDEGRDGRG